MAANDSVGFGPLHGPGVGTEGSNHSGTGSESTAVGKTSVASATRTTALGWFARAIGLKATAVGRGSYAGGDASTAVGEAAFTDNLADAGVALGSESLASKEAATALGTSARASGARSIAIGFDAAVGLDDTAVVKANRTIFVRSNGSGVTDVGLYDSAGGFHVIGVTATTVTFDGAPLGGASLHVGPSAPTDGSVFWYDTDEIC